MLFTITEYYHVRGLKSRTHFFIPCLPLTSSSTPSIEQSPFPVLLCYKPSPANPRSQPWCVQRGVMNSRPGVILFTLTRIVGSVHPCRTRPCHLAFSWDVNTSHSRAPWNTAFQIPRCLTLWGSLYLLYFRDIRDSRLSSCVILSPRDCTNWLSVFSVRKLIVRLLKETTNRDWNF